MSSNSGVNLLWYETRMCTAGVSHYLGLFCYYLVGMALLGWAGYMLGFAGFVLGSAMHF